MLPWCLVAEVSAQLTEMVATVQIRDVMLAGQKVSDRS